MSNTDYTVGRDLGRQVLADIRASLVPTADETTLDEGLQAYFFDMGVADVIVDTTAPPIYTLMDQRSQLALYQFALVKLREVDEQRKAIVNVLRENVLAVQNAFDDFEVTIDNLASHIESDYGDVNIFDTLDIENLDGTSALKEFRDALKASTPDILAMHRAADDGYPYAIDLDADDGEYDFLFDDESAVDDIDATEVTA